MISEPKIFYYCHNDSTKQIEHRQIYRHVDILNESRHDAYVVHQQSGIRLTWFDNNTHVIGPDKFFDLWDPKRDYLVVSGDLGGRISMFPGKKKIIFNTNLNISDVFDYTCRQYPCLDEDVIGIMTVSEHNKLHLELAFPGITVVKVTTGVDPDMFRFRPLASKQKLVACSKTTVPQLGMVWHMLQSRAKLGLNSANDYTLVPTLSKPETEVARILGDSLGFISLNREEAFAQLALEAMMSGCLVAGYQFGPLKECPPFAYECEYGVLTGMVTFLEQLMEAHSHDPQVWASKAEKAYQQVQSSWRLGRESVLAAWCILFRIAR